eukprot:1155402-Pelagomonas_calceolata.AAC.2
MQGEDRVVSNVDGDQELARPLHSQVDASPTLALNKVGDRRLASVKGLVASVFPKASPIFGLALGLDCYNFDRSFCHLKIVCNVTLEDYASEH